MMKKFLILAVFMGVLALATPSHAYHQMQPYNPMMYQQHPIYNNYNRWYYPVYSTMNYQMPPFYYNRFRYASPNQDQVSNLINGLIYFTNSFRYYPTPYSYQY